MATHNIVVLGGDHCGPEVSVNASLQSIHRGVFGLATKLLKLSDEVMKMGSC